MTNLSKKNKLVIFAVAAVILTVAGYFYFFQKPTENNPSVSIQPKSLAEDENYIKEKVEYFLANNPAGITEEYARDVIYEEIAFNEQDVSICEKIKGEKRKNHCRKLF